MRIPGLPSWGLIDHQVFTFLCQTDNVVDILNDENRFKSSKPTNEDMSPRQYYLTPLDMFLDGESEYLVSPAENYRLYQLRVISLMKTCLMVDDDAPENIMYIEGITGKFSFSQERIQKRTKLIRGLVHELPGFFNESTSYHTMNNSKWAGEDPWTNNTYHCEALLVLGLAAGHIKFSFDRELWHTLESEIPYVQFT